MMANLYEVLADAQNGEAITELGRRIRAVIAANSGRGCCSLARHLHGSETIDGNS